MHIAHARIHLPHMLGSSLRRQQLQEGKGLGGIPLKIRGWCFCSLCHQHLKIQGNWGEAPNSKETCNFRRQQAPELPVLKAPALLWSPCHWVAETCGLFSHL